MKVIPKGRSGKWSVSLTILFCAVNNRFLCF